MPSQIDPNSFRRPDGTTWGIVPANYEGRHIFYALGALNIYEFTNIAARPGDPQSYMVKMPGDEWYFAELGEPSYPRIVCIYTNVKPRYGKSRQVAADHMKGVLLARLERINELRTVILELLKAIP